MEMNSRTLEDICKDLDKFYHIIIDMKKHRPLLYDLTIKFPAWRGETGENQKTHSKNHPEDYVEALSADLAKFRAHAEMLQKPSHLITSDTINKRDIVEISQRIMEYLKTYTSHTKNVKDK